MAFEISISVGDNFEFSQNRFQDLMVRKWRMSGIKFYELRFFKSDPGNTQLIENIWSTKFTLGEYAYCICDLYLFKGDGDQILPSRDLHINSGWRNGETFLLMSFIAHTITDVTGCEIEDGLQLFKGGRETFKNAVGPSIRSLSNLSLEKASAKFASDVSSENFGYS